MSDCTTSPLSGSSRSALELAVSAGVGRAAVPLIRSIKSTSAAPDRRRRRRTEDPLAWHLDRENRRTSNRGLVMDACRELSGRAADARGRVQWDDRARKLELCGSLRRHACGSCGQGYGKTAWPCHQRLCPWCSSRRSAVLVDRIAGTLEGLRSSGVAFTLGLLTLTVPDRDFGSLLEAFDALTVGLGRLDRREVWTSAGILGRCTSIEVKRGARSGLWHPHAHVLLVLPASWSRADIAAWGQRVVAEWVGSVMPGAAASAQDCRPVDVAGLSEVVKYAVKASTLVRCADGRPRPVADAAADVAEVLAVLKRRRLVRTAGCLYGLPVADLVAEDAVPEDRPADTPACVCCVGGRIAECTTMADGSGGYWSVPRRWCVPLSGVRGWYVQVLAADWDGLGDPPLIVSPARAAVLSASMLLAVGGGGGV
jgi:hypothetical protein